uniref:Uncharacterized protein n=1 Tax=Ammonifex degensii TaxID=42838 RepID=A0A7C2EIN5_9THEO
MQEKEKLNKQAQKYIASLAATALDLWRKACEYDNIPPESKFVVFSADNPYVLFYNRILTELQEARQQYAASGYVGLTIKGRW